MDRNQSIRELSGAHKAFDIIVIGGGATGLGAAVDAAARGHRVCLLEQADFAKGTSSRSTKLVHGGVRYLQQGNISLVLEALKERGLLYRNAPHLVHNMSFVIPNYKWWEGPFYGIGMKVYDRLAGKLGLSPSKILNREETIARVPNVETDGLIGGVIYHDGQFDDSRLAVNLARTAHELGATVANYIRCVGLLKTDGMLSGVTVRDMETGEEFDLNSRCVINATGIFVDALRSMDEVARSELVTVSQGIHIVLPKHFLPGNAAVMIPKTADGRVLFAVPWHDCVIVGTTDTPLSKKCLEPRALSEERDFVMTHAARYLARDPTDSDVLSVFAGLRPLVKSADAANTAALSRDHTILVSKSGLITITGGKWTTYRKMAQDVIDQAELVAGVDSRKCNTEQLQIHGWTHASPDPSLAAYGADARHIRDLITGSPDLDEVLHPALPYCKAEVVWHTRFEMARCVEDVLARRTRALLLNAKASIEAAVETARLMAGELGMDRNWQQQQVAAYTELARGYVFTDPASTA